MGEEASREGIFVRGCSSAVYGAGRVVRLICTGRWGAGEHRGGVGGEELEHGDLSRRGGRGGQAPDTLGGEQGWGGGRRTKEGERAHYE